MYCMKCGKEIAEKQVFCDSCLEIMKQYPVKSDTRILLPNRAVPTLVKKVPVRKKVLSSEERLTKARKVIQWLSISLVAALIALSLTISLLIDTIGSEESGGVIGQNYSTIDASKDAS